MSVHLPEIVDRVRANALSAKVAAEATAADAEAQRERVRALEQLHATAESANAEAHARAERTCSVAIDGLRNDVEKARLPRRPAAAAFAVECR